MRFYYILLTLIFFVISTVLTEFYLKKIGLGDPVRYDSNYIYGYSPKENQIKKRLKNSTVTINDVGLRTIFDWKKNKKKKIIFFGDSITYGGSYIDDKEIFSHLVCEKLKNYTCGNAGVNAYSIINIVNRSKYDKRLKDINKYIFLVAPGDFYREYADSKKAHFYLNQKRFFLPAITEAISFVATKYDINNFISKRDDTKIEMNKLDLIDYSMALLEKEIKRLENENKDVFLFYTIEKNDRRSASKINKYILSNLSNLKIKNFYSLAKLLNNDQFFYDNVHYSRDGHKAVSEEIIISINDIN